VYNTCTGAQSNKITGPIVNPNTWYLIGLGTTGQGNGNINAELCVNGVSAGTLTNVPVASNSSATTPTSVGSDVDSHYPANGTADEFATLPSQLGCATDQLALYSCGIGAGSCPTGQPTVTPTAAPTAQPTATPTRTPTLAPTAIPTPTATAAPTFT